MNIQKISKFKKDVSRGKVDVECADIIYEGGDEKMKEIYRKDYFRV
jgi:hypothetical protein